MHGEGFLFQAFVYLAAAVLSVPVAKRLGLGSVLGYLIAGVIIGPFALGLTGEEGQDVMHFAEFGVVMMLFLVGLELQPSRLWRLRGPILGLGGLQTALTAAALMAACLAFGLSWKAGLAIGLILALSSTAIVLQTLNENGLLQTESGQSSFSVLLFQDIAVIPMLAVLPFLAMQDGAVSVDPAHGAGDKPVWLLTAEVLAVVAAIILGGRFLVRPIFRFIADTRLREVFTAAALLLVIGIAVAMEAVDLSPALGTFLAGVVLADSEYRHELESNIEPFKGLLLGLFFIAVGASMDFHLLTADPGLIFSLVALLILIKFLVLHALALAFKMRPSARWLFSLSLAQGGEFAFVLFSFATQNQILPAAVTNQLVLVVALSMMLTPVLMILYDKLLDPRFQTPKSTREADPIDEVDNPVIVAGYGRFGQIVSRLLSSSGFKTTLLDHDAAQIDLTRRFGAKVFYGDASRIDLLHAAGAGQARLLVLAIDDRDRVVQMAESVRQHFPKLTLLARAYDRRHAYELMRAGVDIIVRETFDSALDMGRRALEVLGYRANQAYRAALKFKHYDEQSLHELYTVWGDDKAYGLRVRQRTEDLETLLQRDRKQLDLAMDHDWHREEDPKTTG